MRRSESQSTRDWIDAVGIAANGDAALARLREGSVDLVLTDLALGDWQLLEEVSVTSDQTVDVHDPDMGTGESRFYRVNWQP